MVDSREPQQERSRLTRQRLLEVAIDCLAERGWAGTTTTVVAERAGVSRGAAQHHFPTREELATAAIEHMAEARLREIERRFADVPSPARSTVSVVRTLADFYTSPLFRAALQLWVAASSDEALRAFVVPLEARVGREVHRATITLLRADEREPGVREAVQATLDFARGLGLASLLTDDTARRKRLVHAWASALDRTLGRE
jgi:AcrR family transcriptional regulator